MTHEMYQQLEEGKFSTDQLRNFLDAVVDQTFEVDADEDRFNIAAMRALFAYVDHIEAGNEINSLATVRANAHRAMRRASAEWLQDERPSLLRR